MDVSRFLPWPQKWKQKTSLPAVLKRRSIHSEQPALDGRVEVRGRNIKQVPHGLELPLGQSRNDQGGPVHLPEDLMNTEIGLHSSKPEQRIVGDISRELALLGRHVSEQEPGDVRQEQMKLQKTSEVTNVVNSLNLNKDKTRLNIFFNAGYLYREGYTLSTNVGQPGSHNCRC